MWLPANKIARAMDAGYISIAGGSKSCVSGYGYRLRVGKSISRYTNAQKSHESINLSSTPSIVEPIPDTGYACVPGAIYVVNSIESRAESDYNIMLCGTEEGILRGINVLGGGLLTGDCKVVINVVQPVIIKPYEFYAKLQFHQDPQQKFREFCCAAYPSCRGCVFGTGFPPPSDFPNTP